MRWTQPSGGRHPAAPVPDRAHRRVPGHRPGAVGDLLDPVRRTRRRLDPGARRRPETGDLRLSGRERAHLPRGRLQAGHDASRSGRTGDPTGRCSRRSSELFRGATFGDPRIEFVPVDPSTDHARPASHDAEGAPLPALAPAPRRRRRPASHRAGRLRSAPTLEARSPATSPTRSRSCWRRPGSPRETAARPSDACGPRTSPCSSARTPRPSRSRQALRRRGIPAVVTRGDSVLRVARRPPSGAGC